MSDRKIKIEVCTGSAESVLIAQKSGADRAELCSDLFEGGLTPTVGTFLYLKEHATIPMNVMIRPRAGDFCYSNVEFEVMKKEVLFFKEHGASGIVFGILTPDGEIDMVRSKEIIELARPLPVTFHRAFDMTKDAFSSLEKLIELSVDRVLTSGLETSVLEGADTLKELVKVAGDRIIVMPGCGINERNFKKIKSIIGASEYHVSMSSTVSSKMSYHGHVSIGGVLRQDEFSIASTSSERLETVLNLCNE